LRRFDPPIFLGRDIDLSIQQTDFDFLNARLAPEVLFHPVGSKVSGHAFHAQFNVLDLCLPDQRAQQH